MTSQSVLEVGQRQFVVNSKPISDDDTKLLNASIDRIYRPLGPFLTNTPFEHIYWNPAWWDTDDAVTSLLNTGFLWFHVIDFANVTKSFIDEATRILGLAVDIDNEIKFFMESFVSKQMYKFTERHGNGMSVLRDHVVDFARDVKSFKTAPNSATNNINSRSFFLCRITMTLLRLHVDFKFLYDQCARKMRARIESLSPQQFDETFSVNDATRNKLLNPKSMLSHGEAVWYLPLECLPTRPLKPFIEFMKQPGLFDPQQVDDMFKSSLFFSQRGLGVYNPNLANRDYDKMFENLEDFVAVNDARKLYGPCSYSVCQTCHTTISEFPPGRLPDASVQIRSFYDSETYRRLQEVAKKFRTTPLYYVQIWRRRRVRDDETNQERDKMTLCFGFLTRDLCLFSYDTPFQIARAVANEMLRTMSSSPTISTRNCWLRCNVTIALNQDDPWPRGLTRRRGRNHYDPSQPIVYTDSLSPLKWINQTMLKVYQRQAMLTDDNRINETSIVYERKKQRLLDAIHADYATDALGRERHRMFELMVSRCM